VPVDEKGDYVPPDKREYPERPESDIERRARELAESAPNELPRICVVGGRSVSWSRGVADGDRQN
jgi:hypothetical protein